MNLPEFTSSSHREKFTNDLALAIQAAADDCSVSVQKVRNTALNLGVTPALAIAKRLVALAEFQK